MSRVLIVGNQEKIRASLVVAFKREQYEICNEISWADVAEVLRKNKYDLVIADMEINLSDGLEMLKTIKQFNPDSEIIAIIQPNEYSINKVINCGVYDCVFKPFLLKDIVSMGKKALERKKLADKVRNLEQIMDMDKMVL